MSDEAQTTETAAPAPPTPEPKPKQRRGFAVMDREKVIDIGRRGGVAAHKAGTAHTFTTDEARAAGRKGGNASAAKKRQG